MSAYLGTPFTISGAAVPGMPETLLTSERIIQYFNSLLSGQKVNNSNWLLSSAPLNRSGVAKIADWIGIFSNTVTERTCSNV